MAFPHLVAKKNCRVPHLQKINLLMLQPQIRVAEMVCHLHNSIKLRNLLKTMFAHCKDVFQYI